MANLSNYGAWFYKGGKSGCLVLLIKWYSRGHLCALCAFSPIWANWIWGIYFYV